MTAPAGPQADRRGRPRLTPAELTARLGRQHPPTDEQAAVIGAPLADGLVVAGAGSGKTETMAARVVYLVATRQLRPADVLGLTFTRKAAGELAERIQTRVEQLFSVDPELAAEVDPADRRAVVSTYDALAAEVVADHGLRLGIEPGARLLRPAEAWQLADRVVRDWDGVFTGYTPGVSTVVETVRSLHDQLAAHGVAVDRLRRFQEQLCEQVARLPVPEWKRNRDGRESGRKPAVKEAELFQQRQVARRELLGLVEAYGQALAAARAVDFATISASAARLAEEVPEVAAGRAAAHRLVLLDEFQDTSPAQLRMVVGAFAGVPVTAVGDPHQSIYGWRGAGADTLGSFALRRGIAAPDSLSTTFRNDTAVLDAANVLARPLAVASRVPVRSLRPRTGASPGGVVVALHRTQGDELDDVVERVGRAWRDRVGGRSPSVAVLVRTRGQVEALLDALRRDGIEVEVVGLAGLLGVPVVVEVVSVLRVLGDPDRGEALVRLLTGARWRIGPRDLEGLARLAHHSRPRSPGTPAGGADGPDRSGGPGRSGELGQGPLLAPEGEPEPGIVDALDRLADAPLLGDFSAVARRRLVRLARELRGLRARADAPLGELVADVVATTGLGTELRAAEDAGRESASRTGSRQDLAAFVEEAERHAGHGGDRDRAALPAFLAYLDVAEERERGLDRSGDPGRTDEADPDPDPAEEPETAPVSSRRVQLLTVHASKGLEWDAVFVPGVVDAVFPAKARAPKGWVQDLAQLPHALRGDSAGLPALDLAGVGDLGELHEALLRHHEAMGDVRVQEERRLAYVAVTRARRLAVVTGHRWGTTKKPREVSRFLSELAEHARRAGPEAGWELGPWVDGEPGERPEPDPGASALWPGVLLDPDRAAAVEAGAAAVLAAMAAADGGDPAAGDGGDPAAGPPGDAAGREGVGGDPAEGPGGGAAAPGDRLDLPGTPEEVGWARDVDLLLAERARRVPASGTHVPVELPPSLSVSALVALRRDPNALALALRRPVPRRPRPATRLGTRFHAWLEQRWAGERLLDVEGLPGSADEGDPVGPVLDDARLRDLQEAFARSPWADRTPLEVEFPFAMPVGEGLVVRGRIDAVFADPVTGGVEVLDWKTGPPPSSAAREREVAVQLAAYRLAWHRATGTPLAAVTAAFHHVAAGVTVRPADLLDEDGLLALVRDLPLADA